MNSLENGGSMINTSALLLITPRTTQVPVKSVTKSNTLQKPGILVISDLTGRISG
jgi:hypothetical protein